MSTIGQVRRMIRLEAERKARKEAFEHRTRTQDVKARKGSKIVVKTITHFPTKKSEETQEE